MTKEELLKKYVGNMIVNKEVVKTLPIKTMTRRVLKNILKIENDRVYWKNKNNKIFNDCVSHFIDTKAKYKIGDILWIREPALITNIDYEYNEIEYMFEDGVKSKIFIPDRFIKKDTVPKWMGECLGIPNGCIKEMARYFIKIIDVRVEPLDKISIIDIYKEGVLINKEAKITPFWSETQQRCSDFRDIWNSTAKGPYKWEDNPYVIVYEWEYIDYEK